MFDPQAFETHINNPLSFEKLFAEDGKAETVRVSAHRGAVRHSYRRR